MLRYAQHDTGVGVAPEAEVRSSDELRFFVHLLLRFAQDRSDGLRMTRFFGSRISILILVLTSGLLGW